VRRRTLSIRSNAGAPGSSKLTEETSERCASLFVAPGACPAFAGSYLPAVTSITERRTDNLYRKLNSIAAPLRQSLTYDQGKGMSRHGELTAATGVRVYFCDPHSPWQRGTCENTNGLLRQYLPRGTDLSGYSQDELDAIADSLNTRPRATHDYHCPLEVFASMLEVSSQSTASRH
jgi:hypothetical protein